MYRGIYASELVHPNGANPCPRSTSISFFGQFYYATVCSCTCVCVCVLVVMADIIITIIRFGCHISLLYTIDVNLCVRIQIYVVIIIIEWWPTAIYAKTSQTM